MFAPPLVQELTGGRLHLSHGPIDIVLKAWGSRAALAAAYAAARARFPTILPVLCDELAALRAPLGASPPLAGPVAVRMRAACAPFADVYITPMAAVAGAVADELLAHMTAAAPAPLQRAFVNDGGDIAVLATAGHALDIGVASDVSADALPGLRGTVRIDAAGGVGGIATSGAGGRSFSLGIADAVTVLARTAAAADAAATLIANAVDIESASVVRRPARSLDPDSDLREHLVTVAVGALTPAEVQTALARGLARARDYHRRGLIIDAALMLHGQVRTLSDTSGVLAGRLPRRLSSPS